MYITQTETPSKKKYTSNKDWILCSMQIPNESQVDYTGKIVGLLGAVRWMFGYTRMRSIPSSAE